MKKFKINLSFLDRFKKAKIQEPPPFDQSSEDHSATDSDYDSNETPEEFAEKTLSGFNVNQYQEQLQQPESSSVENEEATEEEIPPFQFQEMALPDKPEAAKKFQFKFPTFNHRAASDKIKARFANGSPIKDLDKFSWNDFVLRLFSPYSRGKIHSLFIILFVITLTYMVGKTMALFFSKTTPTAKIARPVPLPPEKPDTTIQDINRITSTNLFNAKMTDKAGAGADRKDIDSIICLDAEKPTSLQIKVLDTIVLQDSVKSVASVQVRGSSELTNLREGERVDNVAEVSKIDRLKLILKNLETGECEYAAAEGDDPPLANINVISPQAGKALFKSRNPNIKNVGNNFKIKKTYRDNMINNMSEVLTQAKAVQITNPDGSLCFKMTEIVPGSIYTNLNIQENDVICNINGRKIDNLNELMGLLGRLREIDQFQIGLRRNGMDENLEYSFE